MDGRGGCVLSVVGSYSVGDFGVSSRGCKCGIDLVLDVSLQSFNTFTSASLLVWDRQDVRVSSAQTKYV